MNIGIIIILVVLNGFFAASEFALVSVKRDRFLNKRYKSNKKIKALLKVTENPSRFLATIQVGITLAGFLASASAAVTISKPIGDLLIGIGIPFLSNIAHQMSLILVTILLSFLTLVFGELVPKRLALEHTEKIALFAAKPIGVLSRVMKPVIFILTKSTDFVAKLLGSKTENAEEKITEEEIRNMIRKGKEEGVLDETITKMLQSIFEFDDKPAKYIMTPSNKMFALDINMPLKELIDEVVKMSYSRIPIYNEDKNDIIGILYIKDLFYKMEDLNIQKINIEKLIREPYFIPETKRIDILYKELKVSQNHMAILVDEYGLVSGLVTMEDILEEIVGEIFDEFDEKIHSITKLKEGVYLADGLESIKKLNEILNLEIPLDISDTIGGFVLNLIDDIPEEGDNPTVSYKDILFKVQNIEDRRITTVKITLNKREEDEE